MLGVAILGGRSPAYPASALVADGCGHGRVRARDMLVRLGVRRVAEAADGAEAVSLLETARPDLLVVDWDIAVIGAAEVLQLARDTAGGQPERLPVVLTMAAPVRSAVERAMALGAGAILVKPYSARGLRARIDALLPAGPA